MENLEINPITGLPQKKQPINPITGLPYPKGYENLPFTGDPTNFGFTRDMSDYTSRGIRVSPYQDIDEQRAQKQGFWETAGRGILRANATFVGGVGTALVGGPEAASILQSQLRRGGWDEVNLAEAFTLQNESAQYFNDKRNEVVEDNPIYKTAKEQTEMGTLKDMFSSHFIFGDFLDGMAYLGAAAASAWVTGGAGIGGLSVRAAATGATAGVGLAARVPLVTSALNAVKATKAVQGVSSAAKATSRYMAATAAAAKSTKALKALRTLPGVEGAITMGKMGAPRLTALAKAGDAAFFLATSEAAVEALETKEASKQNLLEIALKKYNVDKEEDLPIQVRQNIEQLSDNLAGVGYAANLPMLMLTNSIFFSLLKPIQGANKVAGLGVKTGKAAYKPGSMLARTGKFIGADMISESVQEGYQWAIQKNLIDTELNQYNDLGSEDAFYDLVNDRKNYFLEAIKRTPELFEKLAEAPFDQEGRHAMILGALVGGVGSAINLSRTKPFKKEDARGKIGEALLNDEAFGNLRKRAARSNRVGTHLANKERFEKEGNVKAAEKELAAAFQEEAIFHVQNGTFEAFLDRLATEADKPLTEFKEDYQIEDENFTEEDKKRMIDTLAKNLSNLAIFHSNLELLYPTNKQPSGLRRKFYTKAQLEEIENKSKEETYYKNALLRTHGISANLSDSIDSLMKDIKTLIPSLSEEDLLSIKNTKRDVFGEVLSKEELNDKDALDSIQISNEKLVDKLNEVAKKIVDPVSQLQFREFAGELMELMTERDSYDLAKINLTRSPKKRDLFLSRMKQEEANKLYAMKEQRVDKLISTATSSKDLKDRSIALKDDLEGNPALAKKLEDAKAKMAVEEGEIDKKFHEMTLKEVRAIDPKTLTPQEAYVRSLHLQTRTREEAITKKTESEGSKKTGTKKKGKKKEEAAEEEEKKTPVKKATRTRAQKEKASKAASKGLRNTNRSKSKGQFTIEQTEVNGKTVDLVVVDNNGNAKPGLPQRTLNGVQIIDFQYMSSPEVLKGDEVELRVIEDDWWKTEKGLFSNEAPHVNIPIYIIKNGKAIGILESGNDPIREAAYEAYTKKQTVTTTITNKNRGYIFTALEVIGSGESKAKYFYNLKLSENSTNNLSNQPITLGVATLEKGVETNAVISPEDKEALDIQLQELDTESLTLGQVVVIQTAPTGALTILPVQTATLNTQAQEKAIELIKNNDIASFLQLVGTNKLQGEEAARKMNSLPLWVETVGDKTFFIFKPEYSTIDKILSSDLESLKEENDGNMYVRIESEFLTKLLENNLEYLEGLTREQILNLLVKVTPKENADDTEGFSYTSYMGELGGREFAELGEQFLPFIGDVFRDLLQVKRYNVDIEALNNMSAKFTSPVTGNTYKNYYEYLTSEDEQASSRNGSKAILAATFKNVNTNPDGTGGSVFYDVEIRLDAEFKIDGNTQNAEDSAEDTPQEIFTEEVEEEVEEDETDLNALFNPGESVETPQTSVSDIKAKKADDLKRGDIITFQLEEYQVERVTEDSIDVRNTKTGDTDVISKEDYNAELATLSQPAATPVSNAKDDIERGREAEFDRSSSGNPTMASDYLFTGGRGVMLSTDYLLQALVGSFPAATKKINEIRSKYASKIGDIKDDVNTPDYNNMMEEIRDAINSSYENKSAEKIFNKILQNPTGFTVREGNIVSTELDAINEENDAKINAKYDAELARELYKEMKAGKLVTDMTPAEQQVADKYITEELRKSVDAELNALEGAPTAAPVSNAKTDIERRRQEELEALPFDEVTQIKLNAYKQKDQARYIRELINAANKSIEGRTLVDKFDAELKLIDPNATIAEKVMARYFLADTRRAYSLAQLSDIEKDIANELSGDYKASWNDRLRELKKIYDAELTALEGKEKVKTEPTAVEPSQPESQPTTTQRKRRVSNSNVAPINEDANDIAKECGYDPF